MPRVVYIGKESKHVGKKAFQILANLKNFGIGRMITRHEFDKFPEPSFHIVKKIETRMDPELNYGTIWCESVIRGKRLPGIRRLDISYRPDFRLIPKDEEEHYLKSFPIKNLDEDVKVLPKHYTIPPLMREYMIRHYKKMQELTNKKSEFYDEKNQQIKIPFVYQSIKDSRKVDADLFWVENRISKDENDKPTVDFDGKYRFNDEYKSSIESYLPKDQ